MHEDIAERMEIECPGCAARYAVPDGALAPGRATRCAQCGGTWTPLAADDAAEPAPPMPRESGSPPGPITLPADAPVLAATGPLATARRSRLSGAALAGGWTATAIVLLVLAWAAIHFRLAIEAAWPPSARLYGLFAG